MNRLLANTTRAAVYGALIVAAIGALTTETVAFGVTMAILAALTIAAIAHALKPPEQDHADG